MSVVRYKGQSHCHSRDLSTSQPSTYTCFYDSQPSGLLFTTSLNKMARLTQYCTAAIGLLSASALAQQFVMYSPGGDDTSVQRIDPIISPGGISGHVHQVFGANKLSPTLDYDALQSSTCTTVGSADFQGNAADHSIYWHPALYMESSDGSGYVRVPTNGHKMYYLDIGTGQKRQPFEYPHGFRMVAGDPFARASTGSNAVEWKCSTGGSYNVGNNGGFPSGVSTCSDYPTSTDPWNSLIAGTETITTPRTRQRIWPILAVTHEAEPAHPLILSAFRTSLSKTSSTSTRSLEKSSRTPSSSLKAMIPASACTRTSSTGGKMGHSPISCPLAHSRNGVTKTLGPARASSPAARPAAVNFQSNIRRMSILPASICQAATRSPTQIRPRKWLLLRWGCQLINARRIVAAVLLYQPAPLHQLAAVVHPGVRLHSLLLPRRPQACLSHTALHLRR